MSEAGLTGRRVLELGGYFAAPFAGHVLAQLGADVIKVEGLAGDQSRKVAPGTFISQNIGKRGLCLDLRSTEGRDIFDRLLGTADVVVHNLAPDAMRALKITAADCRRVNRDIVYCHITGYGPGPLEKQVATNPLIEAAMGVMYGYRVDGRPSRQGPSFYDMAAGAIAVIGILTALASKSQDPASLTVEVPLYETGLYLGASTLLRDQIGTPPGSPAKGPSEFSRPGYTCYETADGRWIYLIMLTDDNWRQFCEAMSLADTIDPALASVAERLVQQDYVEDLVTRTIGALTFDEAASRLRSVSFGFEEIRPVHTVLGHPQAQHAGKVLTVPFGGRDYRVPNFPILSGSARADVNGAPPLIGEHTPEILQSLGYSEAECGALMDRGVIAAPPNVMPSRK
jgi:crotonobetainyl-CoA:carnitine CoA-transferase CaiB-like acyl-CoA transferase